MPGRTIIDYSRPSLREDFFQLIDPDSGDAYYTNNDSLLFIVSMRELEEGLLNRDHMIAVEEMVRMQYVQVRNILPLYGYQSSTASALVPGSVITQGMLVINKTNDIKFLTKISQMLEDADEYVTKNDGNIFPPVFTKGNSNANPPAPAAGTPNTTPISANGVTQSTVGKDQIHRSSMREAAGWNKGISAEDLSLLASYDLNEIYDRFAFLKYNNILDLEQPVEYGGEVQSELAFILAHGDISYFKDNFRFDNNGEYKIFTNVRIKQLMSDTGMDGAPMNTVFQFMAVKCG
jgi:hypothetical protein